MDTVLGFDKGGNTIFRRDDGTYYSRDPFGLGQVEVLGQGQTAAPHTDSSYSMGELFNGYIPQAFGELVSTTNPDAGSAYLDSRLQILNALGDAQPGVALPQGLSPTAEALNGFASQSVDGAQPIGLLDLLEGIKGSGKLDELTAQIQSETDAYRTARYASGDPFGLKGRNAGAGFGGSGGLGNLVGAFVNPANAFAHTAADLVRGFTMDGPPAAFRNYRDAGHDFYEYEQSLAHEKSPEFQAFLQDFHDKNSALLDSLGLSSEEFPSVANTFDLGSLGGTGSYDFSGFGTPGLGSYNFGGSSSGGYDFSGLSNVFGTSDPYSFLNSLGFQREVGAGTSSGGSGGGFGGLSDILGGIFGGGGIDGSGNYGVLGDIGGLLKGAGGGLLNAILGGLGSGSGGSGQTSAAGASGGSGGLGALLPVLLLGGALSGAFNNDAQTKTREAPPFEQENELVGINTQLARQNLENFRRQQASQEPQNAFLSQLFQDQNRQLGEFDRLLSPEQRALIDTQRRVDINALRPQDAALNAGLLSDFNSAGMATPDQLANIAGSADAAISRGLSDLGRFRDEGLNQARLASASRGLRPTDTPIQNDFFNVQNEANRQAQNFVSGIRQQQFNQNLQFPLQAQQLRLGQFNSGIDTAARRRALEEGLVQAADDQRRGFATGAQQGGLNLLQAFNAPGALQAFTNVRRGNATQTASPGTLDTLSRIFQGLGTAAAGFNK